MFNGRRFGLILALLFLATSASGQGLLERLEKRLEGVLGSEAGDLDAAPTTVEPGYLGLVGDDDATSAGVRVLSVNEGSPAAKAGIRAGDLVVEVRKAGPVANLDDLERRLAGRGPGSKLELVVVREKKEILMFVTLARRPEEPTPADLPEPRSPREDSPPRETPIEATGRASLGITVVPVTDEARRRYELSVRTGALISTVSDGSAADRAGLPIGGVVVAAQGRRIERPDDLIEMVRAGRPGEEMLLSYYQGPTLFRKTVRLGEAGGETRVVAAAPPAIRTERPIDDDRPAADRPLLRRLERALDGVAPERPSGIPFAPEPVAAEEDDLHAEVDRLRARITALERRLADWEDRIARDRPAERAVEWDDDAGPLRLTPAAVPPAPQPPPVPRPEVK